MALIWVLVFIASLFLLIKSSDWLIQSSEKIGLAAGFSPFVVGVTIVAVGTSFPEIISSMAAVFKGATEIVAANAIGSNIANILLIVGFSAVLAKRLQVTKDLIELELPLLAIGTVLFLGTVWDSQISRIESMFLLAAFVIYILYTIIHREEKTETDEDGDLEILPSREERRKHVTLPSANKLPEKIKLKTRDFVLLIIGIAGLAIGAKYLIDSVIELSSIFNITTGVIAISAMAVGTSMPELFVSAKAALKKKGDIALGNIFGSNAFNMFVVVGLPGLFGNLSLDLPTFTIGVPALALATFIFIVSSISKKIYIWEGGFYLLLYLFFVAKLFSLF
jgi:cation:H+ antiporter